MSRTTGADGGMWQWLPHGGWRMKTLLLPIGVLFVFWPTWALGDTCGGPCGKRLTTPNRGSSAQTEGVPQGTWPWLVSIQLPEIDGDGFRHWCGGTLINSRWVLSAAHCFGLKRYIKMKLWRVVVGITQLMEEDPEAQVLAIERLVEHEDYNRIGYLNDIAMIELDQPVVCNEHVQPACLPDSSLAIPQLSHCYFTGWGSTRANKNIMRLEIMQEVRVSLLDTVACNSSRWYFKRIRDNNLCALPDTGSKEACQGAGGGPLMCWEERSERFWVVGVNSWWSGCTEIRMPSVFISTQRFAAWILRVVREGSQPGGRPKPKPKPKPSAQPQNWPRPKPSTQPQNLPRPKPTQLPQNWTPSKPIPVPRPTGWSRPGSRPSFSWGRPNYMAAAQPTLPTRRPAASASSGFSRPPHRPWFQQRPQSLPASQAAYNWNQALPGSSAVSRRPRTRPPYQGQNQGQAWGRL